MNATYWNITDGQLRAGEAVHTGHPDKDAAETEARALSQSTRIAKLTTRESDYPIEDPCYEPFPSARWCVIVTK